MSKFIDTFILVRNDKEGKEFKVLLDLKNIPQGKDLLIENNPNNCSFDFPTGDADCRFVVDLSATSPCSGQTYEKEYTFSLGTPYNGNYDNAKCVVTVNDEDEDEIEILLKNAVPF